MLNIIYWIVFALNAVVGILSFLIILLSDNMKERMQNLIRLIGKIMTLYVLYMLK